MLALETGAQPDTSYVLSHSDSVMLNSLDSLYRDSILKLDTLYYESFVPYDRTIYRNSKINLRKSLTASRNPPLRKNLNNYPVFLWALLIMLFIILFKSGFPLQYRLLNKAWFSNISFNEFFSTQTSVFKNSKLLTWFIISQILALLAYILIQTAYKSADIADWQLALMCSAGSLMLHAANQWLRNLFAYSFNQPSLSTDYAIIYRINSYIASIVLLPVLLVVYYNGSRNMVPLTVGITVLYILLVYASSLTKFIFSGRFLQNQSNFILILYLCAFEILPLLVLIKSINNLLEYD